MATASYKPGFRGGRGSGGGDAGGGDACGFWAVAAGREFAATAFLTLFFVFWDRLTRRTDLAGVFTARRCFAMRLLHFGRR